LKANALIVLLLISYQMIGQSVFDFMDRPVSTSGAALGGFTVSGSNGDLNNWLSNPALLDSSTVDQFSVSVNPYFVDMARYVVSATLPLAIDQKVSVGLIYDDYGVFERLDEVGGYLGTFKPRSYSLQSAINHQSGPFTMGITLKYSHVRLDATSASAIHADLGGTYRSPSSQLVIGMVMSNLGAVVTNSSSGLEQNLPFDVRLGITFKPTYMPLRFTVTAYGLDDLSQESLPESLKLDRIYSNLFRHMNVGTELLLGDYFVAILGYNYRISEALRLPERGFGAGWSFGASLRLPRFSVSLARNTYHTAGGTTFITLQSNYRTIKNLF
jgi:hypothetical protein